MRRFTVTVTMESDLSPAAQAAQLNAGYLDGRIITISSAPSAEDTAGDIRQLLRNAIARHGTAEAIAGADDIAAELARNLAHVHAQAQARLNFESGLRSWTESDPDVKAPAKS